MPIDVQKIRQDFPMLSKVINGKPLVYLDNSATTQKPWQVIDRLKEFDGNEYATVRRGAYKIGEVATLEYEDIRKKIANFINAKSDKEIIFTSGATQSLNLVANSYGKKFVQSGDEIIISNIEHHANIVPWQVLADEKNAVIKVIPVNDAGELIIEEYQKLLTNKTKIVALTHVSNALGTINPVKEMVKMAHDVGAVVVVDGAQSTPHMVIDVQDLNCDFYAFSGHKMYGPSGIGVLYGKYELLDSMPPYVTGGDMINYVSFEKKTTFAKPPTRFEAGTPPISQVFGLGASVDYLLNLGLDNIEQYEKELLDYGTKLLSGIEGLTIIGNAKNKASIISFVLDCAHPHDTVTIIDEFGVACRGGHHCTQPTMKRFGVPATTRASMSFYNTTEEIDILAKAIHRVIEVFK